MPGKNKRIGNYLEVDSGIEIYYEDAGEGQPLVLIPGWTFTTEVFDHQFDEFAKSHRVISFDPRRHGRSTKTLESNNYATQASDMDKLLKHLNVDKPILLGWSTGSYTIWDYVRQNGTDGLRGCISIDMPPLGTSCKENVWVRDP